MSVESAMAMVRETTSKAPLPEIPPSQQQLAETGAGTVVTEQTEQVEVPDIHSDAKSQDNSTSAPEASTSRQSLALLAKKEAAIRQKEREVAAKENELRAREAKAQEVVQKWDTLKKDPWSVLDKEVGPQWYQEATSRVLGQQKNPEDRIKALEQRDIDQLVDQRLESRLKARDEQQQQEYAQQQAIQKFVGDVKETIDSGKEYQLVKNNSRGVERTLNVINDHYLKYQEILNPAEAAAIVEEELRNDARSITKIDGWRELLGVEQPKNLSSKTQKSGVQTLTSELKTTPVRQQTPNDRVESAVRLMAAIKAGTIRP
jgi:hypothetical protein